MTLSAITDNLDVTALYNRIPDRVQPVVKKWYYRVNPWLSWRDRKRKRETEEAFLGRFFDDRSEYLHYRDEFNAGKVPAVITDSMQEFQKEDRKRLFDSHLEECQKIYAYIRKYEPEVLVETGVYNGVSTASLLYALHRNGHGTLYSLDPSTYLRGIDDEDPAFRSWRRSRPSCSEAGSARCPSSKQTGWLVPDDLRQYWKQSSGWSRRKLPSLLDDVGEIDLFFHDSDHSKSTMLFEFEHAWTHLAPGGILFSNHVGWNDAFEIFTGDRTDDCGLVTWHYNPKRDYPMPGRAGYAVKPADGVSPDIQG
ncbi:class I SAM-dependent methyltransferase [Haloarchaeobius sp. TZWWS8]|uniref:class I SAM-dependent methyltransferase n=1 Tax=Haloarchaeobius sp. TZWWS8 TaxID=3446121 RepID=UPI003EB7436D